MNNHAKNMLALSVAAVVGFAAAGKAAERAAPAAGFVFRPDGVHHRTDRRLAVSLGEKISRLSLGKRFAGYEVRYTEGEDCLTCAEVAGRDGAFRIDFAQDGRTVVGLSSSDARSRDAEGNAVGASLPKALGSTSAECDAGMDTTCRSPGGIWYIVADDDRCPLAVKEKQATDIPACARIAGFQIQGD